MGKKKNNSLNQEQVNVKKQTYSCTVYAIMMKFSIKGIDPKLARRRRQKLAPATGFFSSVKSTKNALGSTAKANKNRVQAKRKKKRRIEIQETACTGTKEVEDIYDYDAYKKKATTRRNGM